MAKANGFWSGLFRTTRKVYRIQHGARTFRAIASGKPGSVARLYGRRVAYKLFNRVLRGVGL